MIIPLSYLRGFAGVVGMCSLALFPSSPMAADLVQHSGVWHYRKGTNAPPADWKTSSDASLDGSWLLGAGGIGYGDGDDVTALSDMQGRYTSVYLRTAFTSDGSVANLSSLFLKADWDDGFVAWLDGKEIARRNAPGVAGTEPLFTAVATGGREASAGGGAPAELIDLGVVGARLSAGSHVLAIQGLNEQINSSDLSMIFDLSTGSAPPLGTTVGGYINKDTTWRLSSSPYLVVNNLTIQPGVSFTIEPGVDVMFLQGRSIESYGKFTAEGTPTHHIRFRPAPGVVSWTQFTFRDNLEPVHLSYCDIEDANGIGIVSAANAVLHMDHVEFFRPLDLMLGVRNTAVLVQNCRFPSVPGSELIGFFGMPTNGYARFEKNIFGTPGIPATSGYNDDIDLTGGNRPGPIAEFYDNIFTSGVDDALDLDGTDAHIEGNVFLNIRQDEARPSTSNSISTGSEPGFNSNLVIVRNIFYNCEHMALLKENATALMQNNTVVHLVSNPLAGAGQVASVVNFSETNRGTIPGDSAVCEGNIFWDIEGNDFFDHRPPAALLSATYSFFPGGQFPGVGNITGDPLFVSPTGVDFLNYATNLALRPTSPCRGAGPNGIDMGAMVAGGATLSGAPSGTTSLTSATLKVAGPGIFAYRWRLNGGAWSDEVALTTNHFFTPGMFDHALPIVLTNLADGSYGVQVIGKNSAGTWQSTNTPTVSSTWTVQSGSTQTLRFDSIVRTSKGVLMSFRAEAGATYSVLATDSLSPAQWVRLSNVSAPATPTQTSVLDPASESHQRFYRLVSPSRLSD